MCVYVLCMCWLKNIRFDIESASSGERNKSQFQPVLSYLLQSIKFRNFICWRHCMINQFLLIIRLTYFKITILILSSTLQMNKSLPVYDSIFLYLLSSNFIFSAHKWLHDRNLIKSDNFENIFPRVWCISQILQINVLLRRLFIFTFRNSLSLTSG